MTEFPETPEFFLIIFPELRKMEEIHHNNLGDFLLLSFIPSKKLEICFFFSQVNFCFIMWKKTRQKRCFFILLMIICPGYSSWIKKIMGKKISKIIQEIFFFPSGKYILQIFFFQGRIFLSFYEKSISLDFFFHFFFKSLKIILVIFFPHFFLIQENVLGRIHEYQKIL